MGTDRWQAGVLPVADKAELDPEVEPREREQVWDSRNKELSQVIRSGAPGAERDGPGGGDSRPVEQAVGSEQHKERWAMHRGVGEGWAMDRDVGKEEAMC